MSHENSGAGSDRGDSVAQPPDRIAWPTEPPAEPVEVRPVAVPQRVEPPTLPALNEVDAQVDGPIVAPMATDAPAPPPADGAHADVTVADGTDADMANAALSDSAVPSDSAAPSNEEAAGAWLTFPDAGGLPTREDMFDDLGGVPPQETAEAARRRRRLRMIALGAIGAVLLCVGLVLGPPAWALIRERNATIATPPQIAGLTLDQSENAQGTADYLKTAVETGVSFDSAVAAVYTDGGAEPRTVIFVGGTGLFMTPDKELRSMFDLLSDQTGGVEQVRSVPSGSLGGIMKCGTTSTDDGSMAVCGWADHGSIAVALFPDRGVDESALLMRTMRQAMQRRD